MERITPQLFYQYSTCPQWIWFDRFGDPELRGETNELFQKIIEQGVVHEESYMAELVAEHEVVTINERDTDTAVARTVAAMKKGADFIYHGHLRNRHFYGIPDLLVKIPGTSRLGSWMYKPVDIKSSRELKDDHKFQLTLYSLVLGDVQGVEPSKAGIISGDKSVIEFTVEPFKGRFFDTLEKIEKIIAGEKPAIQFTKACMNTPWYEACKKDAEETDDIALLYKVDKRALEALRGFNIRTIEDARHVNPEALGDSIPFLRKNGLERMKLQAESLKTNTVVLRRNPTVPSGKHEIFFDIEGDPLEGFDYLFGVLLDDVYTPFVAQDKTDVKRMWLAFSDWIVGLPDEYIVFHYAPYEKTRVADFLEEYRGEMSEKQINAVEKFLQNLFDLSNSSKEDFVFPLYFYGLKQICKFLGFSWRSDKAGGMQSIIWYEEWLRDGNKESLQTVTDYNEDDVRATKFLKDWMITFSSSQKI